MVESQQTFSVTNLRVWSTLYTLIFPWGAYYTNAVINAEVHNLILRSTTFHLKSFKQILKLTTAGSELFVAEKDIG